MGLKSSLMKNGVAFTALSTGYDYFNSKAQGKTTMEAAGSAAGTALISHLLPWWVTTGVHTAPIVNGALSEAVVGTQRRARDIIRGQTPFSNANFADSTQKYTMRQAGMSMIEQAEYDQQNAMLGREAKYMNY